MTPRTRFKSFLGPDVEQFLAHKRSLGRRLTPSTESMTPSLSCASSNRMKSASIRGFVCAQTFR
jgi:hypothetical protein